MNKSLSILVSELRSLEYEYKMLDTGISMYELSEKSITTDDERRLAELKFELIPLVKLQTSEILFFNKNYERAIEIAKDSAYQSSMYTSVNPNSAKVSKIGFDNLAIMYEKLGDEEAAALCSQKAKDIEVPMTAFIGKGGTVRDVVLRHYFGDWGHFLFPG
ncbi:unnamed protein product [Ambrosiozyma monospora]|uniref:Unnamed protein product n=1 Tax=Ambrosiozyma monospora TaxID=43982 RepID=A0ACB5T1U6_AMBMO|nr:unnamed protein product [Ambrosiozyma monospora]